MNVLLTLFSWPNGIVVGNLIASALWAIPAILHLDRLMRRHHKEHMEAVHNAANPEGNENAQGNAQRIREKER